MATFSHNPEFSEQQTQHLQDIARNGSADEYDYGDNGPSNDFDDLDPTTLLKSLAEFEHPASSSEPLAIADPPTVSEAPAASERHFQSLLQAVATADGAEAAQARVLLPNTKNSIIISQTATPKSAPKSNATKTSTKRKRQEVEDDDEGDLGFIVTAKYKKYRKRKAETDEEELLARERAIWGPDDDEGGEIDGGRRQSSVGTADARALGVHSAAALFRRPSAASKKYTSELAYPVPFC